MYIYCIYIPWISKRGNVDVKQCVEKPIPVSAAVAVASTSDSSPQETPWSRHLPHQNHHPRRRIGSACRRSRCGLSRESFQISRRLDSWTCGTAVSSPAEGVGSLRCHRLLRSRHRPSHSVPWPLSWTGQPSPPSFCGCRSSVLVPENLPSAVGILEVDAESGSHPLVEGTPHAYNNDTFCNPDNTTEIPPAKKC